MTAACPAPPKISLVLADVDGTLLTKDKILTPRAAMAVKALHDRGIRFAITSGRPPRGMAMLIDPLALRTPIAGFNGGVFVKPDLSVIQSRTLDPSVARQTVVLILDEKLDVWVYTADEWLIRDPDAPHVARETRTVKFEAKVVQKLTAAHLAQAVKIVGISDDLDRVAACEKRAQKELGDKASAARSQPYYLDVTHPSANKGAVVAALSKLLKVSCEEIATVGDMPNDVSMFRNSGFSIAMGNSSDEVKAQASAVTDNNANDGFAKAMEVYILRAASKAEHMTNNAQTQRSWSPAPASAKSVLAVVMGVSGSGKTTVAVLLAAALNCQFQEGDELHPDSNAEKMRHGTPLTDADRLPWLRKIAAEIDGWRGRGESGVLACSALKRSYRDIIIGDRADVNLVYLKGDYDLIHRRMAARQEHFMPVALLDSQFKALEEPVADERPIVVEVKGRPAEIVAEIVHQLELRQSGQSAGTSIKGNRS